MSKGLKFDSGKLRYDLVPFEVIDEYVRCFNYGALKYEANSWKDLSDFENRYSAALGRHYSDFRKGQIINEKDGGLYTLAQIMWNAGALLWKILQEKKQNESK